MRKRAANLEPARAAGKRALSDVRVLVRQAVGDAEFVGRPAEQFGRRSREQMFAGRVDQAQALPGIEREYRDVGRTDDLGQQRAGFLDLVALVAQGLRQRVDLPHDLADRIAAARARAAQAEVAFAQRFEKIRQCIQWVNHAVAQAHRKPQRQHGADAGQSPQQPGRKVAPYQHRSEQRARRRGDRERREHDACVVGPAFVVTLARGDGVGAAWH